MTNEGNGAIMRELGISKQAYDFVRSAENSIKRGSEPCPSIGRIQERERWP